MCRLRSVLLYQLSTAIATLLPVGGKLALLINYV